MDTLIGLVFIMAAIALVWWGAELLPLPPPVRVFLIVVLGLIALVLIYRALMGVAF
jgi:hypothetical protein